MNQQRKKLCVLGLFILLSANVFSDPSPVSDEAFLLYLAEMVEVDGELTDGIDLASMDIKSESLKKTEQNEGQEAFEEAGDI